MDKPIAAMRKEYLLKALTEGEAGDDPLALFTRWFQEMVRTNGEEPNAMALATVAPDGSPSCRTVLLKGYDERGFVFYTNYDSRKAREMAANVHVALCFWWAELERQVRIEGTVERVSAAESDEYFHSRPRLAQIGAMLSPQSSVIASRDVLEQRLLALQAEFVGKPIPRPETWGGYRCNPRMIEFWQGREFRLHDRLRFSRQPDGGWKRERLAP